MLCKCRACAIYDRVYEIEKLTILSPLSSGERQKQENMKQLKDIPQLTPGCTITRIYNGEVQTWEYLMYHQHNKKYILALNACTQEAYKLYISTMLECGLYWCGEYDSNFVLRERIKQYECKIENLKARISDK
jgi:hypothetical protein|nr:MAG TPA: hypothetical protein [Caudoviricetes sp.]